MAELLLSFDTPIRDELGAFRARAVGRRAAGMWEGWLEFVPIDGAGEVLVTGVETTQPEHGHLVYWATGLTPVYLEGALQRARHPRKVRVPPIETPASRTAAPYVETAIPWHARGPEPVLDPFEIAARSADVLYQELLALNRPRLLNIIAAYDLNPSGEDLAWMTDAQLARFIVVAVDVLLRR